MKILAPALAGLLTILFLDFIWLGKLATEFYKSELGSLMKASPLSSAQGLFSAAVVYACLIAGLHFFVLPQNSLGEAFSRGALFGLVSYGIYDFTNLCTLNGWTFKLSLVDVLWGGFLCGSTALVITWTQHKMG